MSPFPKHELEDAWREKLRLARERYEEAAKAFRASWEEHSEGRPTTDSTFAIQHARKLESHALAEYMRVLKIFADLLLHGRVPEEPPK
ncbi:MAG TPA: hypothetical protein VME43_17500 [Bryobacteraceae bacterium]|nr:hypothetical protein [Bryobacteraceae bacterium]